MEAPVETEKEEKDVIWTEQQKEVMNDMIFKSRFKYQKQQMRNQRAGKARLEVRKAKHAAPSAASAVEETHITEVAAEGASVNEDESPELAAVKEVPKVTKKKVVQPESRAAKLSRAKRAAKEKAKLGKRIQNRMS